MDVHIHTRVGVQDNLMVAVHKDVNGQRVPAAQGIGAPPYDCTALLYSLPFEVLAIKISGAALTLHTYVGSLRRLPCMHTCTRSGAAMYACIHDCHMSIRTLCFWKDQVGYT